jgi:crotonobetainyl-CoA:carnitine CoA-transferase CaiB-like acyl-CoA transferase
VKVESTRRPDGARRGPSGLFDLLNAGKRSVALDFASTDGRRDLERLIRSADVVVESARPRALRQLGIDAERIVAETPGLSWLGITGYGRTAPEADWVAFGDDAAAAAGLVAAMGVDPPIFAGDAIADPLTGLHAAVAALASHRAGGGRLLDVSLVGATRHALATGTDLPSWEVVRRADASADRDEWMIASGDRRHPVRPPRSRTAACRARTLGADTQAELASLVPC